MLSRSMYKTVLQQAYERYATWAAEDRRIAESSRAWGLKEKTDIHTERANDFARQATEAMRDIARMEAAK